MKRRFILYRRKLGGMFYIEDTETRKQESLGTKDRADALLGKLFPRSNPSGRLFFILYPATFRAGIRGPCLWGASFPRAMFSVWLLDLHTAFYTVLLFPASLLPFGDALMPPRAASLLVRCDW
jgi:hypothetical protein